MWTKGSLCGFYLQCSIKGLVLKKENTFESSQIHCRLVTVPGRDKQAYLNDALELLPFLLLYLCCYSISRHRKDEKISLQLLACAILKSNDWTRKFYMISNKKSCTKNNLISFLKGSKQPINGNPIRLTLFFRVAFQFSFEINEGICHFSPSGEERASNRA